MSIILFLVIVAEVVSIDRRKISKVTNLAFSDVPKSNKVILSPHFTQQVNMDWLVVMTSALKGGEYTLRQHKKLQPGPQSSQKGNFQKG